MEEWPATKYIQFSWTYTLGARDFSSAVSGFCQVFIVTRAKSFSRGKAKSFSRSFATRGFGLRPKMCRPSANTEISHRKREKPLVPRVLNILEGILFAVAYAFYLSSQETVTFWGLLSQQVCLLDMNFTWRSGILLDLSIFDSLTTLRFVVVVFANCQSVSNTFTREYQTIPTLKDKPFPHLHLLS